MDFKKLPKIDLHCHLDGSLTKEMMKRYTGKEITDEMIRVNKNCTSLRTYLEKFDLPLSCLQDEKGLREGAEAFMEESAKDHVKYIEARFAPMLSVHQGLSCGQVIESVLQGMEAGKEKYGIKYQVIVCAMRQHSLEQNAEMLETAGEFLGKGVCALDLAGDEAAYPTEQFRKLFEKAKKIGMPFTIHSGETGNVDNVRCALELGAKRIGHGIALKKNKELMKDYRKAGIGIELCPTSNFQTKAVSCWEDYPLLEFLDNGLIVNINTDNRTVSDTNMTKELELIYERYGKDETLIHTLLKNAQKMAFINNWETLDVLPKEW